MCSAEGKALDRCLIAGLPDSRDHRISSASSVQFLVVVIRYICSPSISFKVVENMSLVWIGLDVKLLHLSLSPYDE